MTHATLDAWLSVLEQRHPSAIDLGLDRVGLVADRLACRHFNASVITVAGTNGKGSTVATLVMLARAIGLRVASYTSPHLLRFNERICLDGREITDAELIPALDAVESARGDVSLTYFEHTTLAAFWWFQRCQPDLVVLEVGLGGRLDAVNLVDADVAVITSVDLDHQDWLGDNREDIGREKAGILRAGRPVVLGEAQPPASVLARAEVLGCPVSRRDRDFSLLVDGERWGWRAEGQAAHAACRLDDLPRPALALDNVATAFAAWHALGLAWPGLALLREHLPRLGVAGRAQRLPGQPEVWLDVGHNPHGAAFLWQQLPPCQPGGRTHAVIGMLRDKDVAGVIAVSRQHVDRWWPASLSGPRALSGGELADRLAAAGIAPEQISESVTEALRAARHAARATDRIVVLGSFLTVAAVLSEC